MPSQSPSPTIRTLASGFSPDGDWPSLDDVWRAAEPALRARSNDIHTPLSFAFAELLLEAHPEADPLVVRVAILLHEQSEADIKGAATNRALREHGLYDSFFEHLVRVLQEPIAKP